MAAAKKFSKHSFLSLIAALTMTLLLAAMFCIVFLPRDNYFIVVLKSNYDGGSEYVFEMKRGEKVGNELTSAVSRDFYELDGLFTDPLCGEETRFELSKEIGTDITLYAKWKPIKYTLAADTGDGVSYYTYDAERFAEFSDPVREGFVFGGWYLSPECKENEKVDKKWLANHPQDAVVYAKWIPVSTR